jgi:hypothetical protein
MKAITATNNAHQWPRHNVASVDCRKRDLIVRITNWMDDKEEPAYDVEVYIGGVFDWTESESFTLFSGLTKKQAKAKAIEYANSQIAKLL